MLKEEAQVLWRTSATLLGVALPLILLGKALTSVCLILGIIIGMLATKDTSLRSSIYLVLSSTPAKLGGIFLLTLLLSGLFSIDIWYSLRHVLQITGMAVAVILLFIVFREMPTRHVHLTLRVLCLTMLFVIVLTLLDAFLNDERLSAALHGRKAGQPHRLNFMSSTLAVMLPFLWAWLITHYRESEIMAKWAALPVAAIGFLTIFVAGGRAGWLGIIVAAVLFMWFISKYHDVVLHRRHWLLAIFIGALGPIAYGAARGFDQMWARINLISEKLGAGSGRLEIWEFARGHMLDNPITGIGINAFRKLPIPEGGIVSNAHPHNFLIQLFLETGLLGLVAALALIVWLFYIFWGYAKGNLYGLAGLASISAFFIASLFNTSIFQPWWLAFLIFASVFAARIGWAK